jgi:hypothetical protein
MPANLTHAQAAAWRFARHGLLDRSAPGDPAAIAARLGGLHAQVMSSAELSVHARAQDVSRDAVSRALWEERTLYKTWAMRGTLHLLPAAERGMWQAAFAGYSNHFRPSWLKWFGLTREQLEAALAAMADALATGPLTRAELATEVTERTGDPALGENVHGSWGSYLKPAAYRGDLCFAPSAGPKVRFTHPDSWLAPAVPVEAGEALREITRRYLGAYGPATREDLSRWWGVSGAAAGRMLAGLGDEVIEVDVEGARAHLLAAHLEDATAAAPQKAVRLLPAFDPYVAGAPRDGRWIFPAERRAELYRQAGWLTPAVVVDGVIAGVFRSERKGARLVVGVQPWRAFPRWLSRAAESEAERLADWLGLRLELSFAAV